MSLDPVHTGSIRIPSGLVRLLHPVRFLPSARPIQLLRRDQIPNILHKYKDMFAWSHEDMKGLDPKFYQHQINLATDAKPVQQRRYRMNPNYVAHVKEEMDKLLKIGFIRPIKQATWLSPIIVVTKKNGKIRVYVDFRKTQRGNNYKCFSLLGRRSLWMGSGYE